MNEDINTNECADPTQNFTVELPCRMVERIERYAKEKDTSVDSVLIEAIDVLLRRTECRVLNFLKMHKKCLWTTAGREM